MSNLAGRLQTGQFNKLQFLFLLIPCRVQLLFLEKPKKKFNINVQENFIIVFSQTVYFSCVLQDKASYKSYVWHKSKAKCNVKRDIIFFIILCSHLTFYVLLLCVHSMSFIYITLPLNSALGEQTASLGLCLPRTQLLVGI